MNHTDTTGPLAWRHRGACRSKDPELFYGPDGEGVNAYKRRVRAAKRVCFGCPIRDECLAWALETGERYGVWGGMTERERQRIASGPTGHPRTNTVRADRFDHDAIREAIASLLSGTSDALRERLNRTERWEAVEILCQDRKPVDVAALMEVDPNTVYSYRQRRRAHLEQQGARAEAA